MADDEAEDAPTVELGTGAAVEGAPIARVTARLHYGIPLSDVAEREGDTTVRTPDGPRSVADLLAEVDETYFGRREDLESALREAAGTGPIPTED